MSVLQSQTQSEATPLENGADLGITNEYPENMIPTGDFYKQRERTNDIDAKTREAIAIAAQNGLDAEYVQDGIDKLEVYANKSVEVFPENTEVQQLTRIGEWLAFSRSSES